MPSDTPLHVRLGRLFVSIAVLTLVTVIVGYGGWAVLAVSAALGGPDPTASDGEPWRERLFAWPERNREVMRTDGREPLSLRP